MRRVCAVSLLSLAAINLVSCSAGGKPKPPASGLPSISTTVALPSAMAVDQEGVLTLNVGYSSSALLGAMHHQLKTSNRSATITGVTFTVPSGLTVTPDNTVTNNCYNATTGRGATISNTSSCNVRAILTGATAGQTYDATVHVTTSKGAVSLPVDVHVVGTASSVLPAITATSTSLAVGSTVNVTVTNNSSKIINFPQVVLAGWLNAIATNKSLSLKDDLAPGASHVFTFDLPDTAAVRSALVSHAEEVNGNDGNDVSTLSSAALYVAAANNRHPQFPVLSYATTTASAGAVEIVQPGAVGQKTMVFTNHLDEPITLTAVPVVSGSGYSVASGGTCTSGATLAARGTCTVLLQATTSTTSAGTVTFDYRDAAGSDLTATANVVTSPVTIHIAGTHIASQGSTMVLDVYNGGNFDWVPSDALSDYTIINNSAQPNITIPTEFSVSGGTCLTVGSLAPSSGGTTCTVKVTVPSDQTLASYDLAIAAKNNLAEQYTKTFTVGSTSATTISVDDDTDHSFPQVKRIAITAPSSTADATLQIPFQLASATNFTLYNATDNDGTASTSKGPWCTSVRCPSPCTLNAGSTTAGVCTIAAGETKYIYLRANPTVTVGSPATSTLTIGGTSLSLSDTSTLYAGGNYEANEEDAPLELNDEFVAAYNGTNWVPVSGSSVAGTIRTMQTDALGNLYMAGSFDKPFTAGDPNDGYEYVVKYNGASWADYGEIDYFHSSVLTMAFSPNGVLYAAGEGENGSEGSSEEPEHYRTVAKEVNGEWQSIATSGDGFEHGKFNKDINAIAFDGNGTLYAGGDFDVDDNTDYEGVMKYASGSWSSLSGQELDDYVYSLATYNDYVYVGGEFHNDDYNYMARYDNDGASWSDLDQGVSDDVRALAIDSNGVVYATGDLASTSGHILFAEYENGAWEEKGTEFHYRSLSSYGYAIAVGPAGHVYIAGDIADPDTDYLDVVSYDPSNGESPWTFTADASNDPTIFDYDGDDSEDPTIRTLQLGYTLGITESSSVQQHK